jgi:UDP-GlcNAc:undecaprenyl-phosphate GlcNAc-1-phosphate transferase
MVMLVMINGARASYRVFQHWNAASNTDGDPVVIYGAGKGGVLALREILTNTAVAMHPVGFIDDNPLMRGRFINGYPVLGSLDELAEIVLTGKARGVVVASEKIPIAKVLSAKDVCNARGAWMRVFRVDFRHVSGDAPARFSATTRLD